MGKGSVLQALGQVSAEEAGAVFREYLRGATRRVGKVVHNQRGSSKSSVSRLWQEVGREKLAQLRGRPLDVDSNGKPRDWLALMLDGVALAKDVLAVVAIGITVEGWKVVLDFELGASENVTVATAVVGRIVKLPAYKAGLLKATPSIRKALAASVIAPALGDT